jgi:hypothetical protein
MRRRIGILVIALVAGCGGSNDGPAQSPAPVASAAPSASAERAEGVDRARARARQLGAAAGAWRRGHSGMCPTVKAVLDAYALPSGTELDASGAPFTIECGDAEIRVFASSHELADAQPYSAVVATIPNDAPPGPDGMTPSVPARVQNAEAVLRSLVEARARLCYSQALKRDPNQAGELHGTMTVNGDGSVKSVVVDKKSTTLTDPDLIDCLTTAMKASHHPPSDGAHTEKF